MKLMELRYNKLPFVEKIMAVVDDMAMGLHGNLEPIFQKYGIDPNKDPEEVRKDITIMDEFKIVQLHRALVGGK